MFIVDADGAGFVAGSGSDNCARVGCFLVDGAGYASVMICWVSRLLIREHACDVDREGRRRNILRSSFRVKGLTCMIRLSPIKPQNDLGQHIRNGDVELTNSCTVLYNHQPHEMYVGLNEFSLYSERLEVLIPERIDLTFPKTHPHEHISFPMACYRCNLWNHDFIPKNTPSRDLRLHHHSMPSP